MQKTNVLFSIDLRIDKKPLKLKVAVNDSLSDLISKLEALITWRKIPHQKMKGRLEEQIKKIVTKENLSNNVKNKLNDLLDESKFVIVGIETQNRNDDETPFKILQESTLNGRKIVENSKHYQYLNQSQALSLRMRYESKDLQKENCEKSQRRGSSSTFQRSLNNTKSKYSPQKYSYLLEENQPELMSVPLVQNRQFLPLVIEQKDDSLQRKYEAIDRKCEDYIKRNVSKSEKMRESYDRYQHNRVQRENYKNAEPQQKRQKREIQSGRIAYEPEIKVRKFDDSEEIRMDQKTKYHLAQNVFNRRNLLDYQQNGNACEREETFQQYKVNRHQSTNHISKQPLFRENYESKKLGTQFVQKVPSSKSSTRLWRNEPTQDLTREYPQSSSYNLKRDPSKKFNYLSEAI